MPTTTGMKGGGYYDSHSHEQREALEAFLPWLELAVAEIAPSMPADVPVHMLDIGSSEGGNALHAMQRLIRAVRGHSDAPVWAWFNDLPSNDFNRLFANLFAGGHPALGTQAVYSGAIGGSAFDRLVPAGCLQVATTFNTLGFLDTRPDAALPDFILPMGPGPLAPRAGVSVSDDEREPFRVQAAADLRRFYAARAVEMVPGGKMLVQVFGADARHSTHHGIYDVLSDALLDRVEAGQLSRQTYRDLVFPIYFRRLDELLEPLQGDTALAQAWCVEQAASKEVRVPFNEALARDGDIASWAGRYTGFLRAFTEAILAASLPDDANRAATLEAVYARITQRLVAEPARYAFHYISIGALLTRSPTPYP